MTRPAGTAALLVAALALTAASGCSSPMVPRADVLASGPACGRAQVAGVAHVSNASELKKALSAANPGEAVVLAAGTYRGQFVAATAGTATAPILLCGAVDTVLEGGGSGYTLHLERADWWEVSRLTIHGGEKGLVLDSTNHTTIAHVRVWGTAQEAVHLRTASSSNTLDSLRVDHTGLNTPRFGEGVYVGSARENWCRYASCDADRSDGNTITGCVFGPGITAEAIDIKEGTTGGTVKGNEFDGRGTTAVDSWIDVKGNDWIIQANTGSHAPLDGAQVHVRLAGWGQRTTFRANRFRVGSDGYGIRVQPGAVDTTVSCDNFVLGASAGLSNIACAAT